MPKTYQNLIEGNKKWVEENISVDPEYFVKQAQGQSPPILWIGCADSRVPANVVTNTSPGDIFVHRNIANMVVHTDMNMLSVLDYAVNVLKVKHVIVCGHYECGGVNAAMGNQQFGLIDNWLRHIKDVYRLHKAELDAIDDPVKRARRFVEVNVIEQVHDLCKTSIIQNAWKERNSPEIHGWVYDISTGYIIDLKVSVSNDKELQEVYRFASPKFSDKLDL